MTAQAKLCAIIIVENSALVTFRSEVARRGAKNRSRFSRVALGIDFIFSGHLIYDLISQMFDAGELKNRDENTASREVFYFPLFHFGKTSKTLRDSLWIPRADLSLQF